MDVCVGVCILCNYASSSDSNDTPAGIIRLFGDVCPVNHSLAETEQHCVEQLLSKTLLEHQRARQHGGSQELHLPRAPPTSVLVFTMQQTKGLLIF